LDLCGGRPDEACEGRDFWPWDAEAGADEFVERQFQLHAGFGKPQHDVARVAALVADGPAGDFSFRDEGADVVFGSVGVDRYLRAFENAQEPVLVAKQPSEQPIERGVSRAGALEDPVETGAQELGLFHAGGKLVVLQGTIEPPDHPLGDLQWRCAACRWREPAYGRDVRHVSSTVRVRRRETDPRRQKTITVSGSKP